MWFWRISGGQVQTIVAPPTPGGESASPDLSRAQLAYLTSHPDQPITVPGQGVDRFRVLAQPGGRDATSVVGAPLDDVDSSSRRLLTVEVGATGAVLALLALAALWVLRLGVRPVTRMAEAAWTSLRSDLARIVTDATDDVTLERDPTDPDRFLLAVTDDGPGMDRDLADRPSSASLAATRPGPRAAPGSGWPSCRPSSPPTAGPSPSGPRQGRARP